MFLQCSVPEQHTATPSKPHAPSLWAIVSRSANLKSGKALEEKTAWLPLAEIIQVNTAWTIPYPLPNPLLSDQRLRNAQTKGSGLSGSPVSLPPPQPYPDVHLSNIYAQIAADKYLMCTGSEEVLFYLKSCAHLRVAGHTAHTLSGRGCSGAKDRLGKNTVKAVSSHEMI